MCFKGFSFDIKRSLCIIFSWAILRILWFILPYFKTKGVKKTTVLTVRTRPLKGVGRRPSVRRLRSNASFFIDLKNLLYARIEKTASRGCYEIHQLR